MKKSTLAIQFRIGLILGAIGVIIGLVNECSGQTLEQRENNARAYKYQTEFNGMKLNFVNLRVQNFLQKEMTMAQAGEPVFDAKDSIVTITENYSAPSLYQFQIQYICKPQGHDLLIKSCKIFGTPDKVTKFFVWFWETTLNFNEAKKDEVVVSHFITDRVALSVFPAKRYAEILIAKR